MDAPARCPVAAGGDHDHRDAAGPDLAGDQTVTCEHAGFADLEIAQRVLDERVAAGDVHSDVGSEVADDWRQMLPQGVEIRCVGGA
jgi:hypothetical protein